MMVETLLSDTLCADRTANEDIRPGRGGSFLIDSPYGISVIQSGSYDAVEYRAEPHYGKLTQVMGEIGLPLATRVTTSSGRVGTLADVLQDTIMRFSWDRELEFIGSSLAFWLPPERSWTNQFGEKFTFDELVMKLLRRPLGEGCCCGCHVPYAVAMILRADGQHPVLSTRVRQLAFSWLRRVSETLEKNQLPDGGWERDWGNTGQERLAYNDPALSRITLIGHHLEWMAFVPSEYRLPNKAIAKAVIRVEKEIDELPPLPYRSFKALLPCSHVARALCCCKGVDPFESFLLSRKAALPPKKASGVSNRSFVPDGNWPYRVVGR